MSDTYWPTDKERIEVRILIPLPEGTDPQEVAEQVTAALDEYCRKITPLPFWYVAEYRKPDGGMFDPPEPSLRVVDGGL